MGGGRAAGRVRRAGVGGVGSGAASVGGIVSLSARDVWAAEMGTADFVPLYLAGVIFCTTLYCYWLHRARGLRGVLLAGTGYGPRAP